MAYNCVNCIAKGMQDSRICFAKNFGGVESAELEFPIFDPDGNMTGERESRQFTVDSIYELLLEYSTYPLPGVKPGVNPFVLCMNLFPEICPVGLIDDEFGNYIQVDSLCTRYHVLPFAGGLLDQPSLMIDCFDTIATAEADFNNDSIEKMKSKGSRE